MSTESTRAQADRPRPLPKSSLKQPLNTNALTLGTIVGSDEPIEETVGEVNDGADDVIKVELGLEMLKDGGLVEGVAVA